MVSFIPQGQERDQEWPAGLELPARARNMKKHPLKLFSIILDPVLNQKVHLIQIFSIKRDDMINENKCFYFCLECLFVSIFELSMSPTPLCLTSFDLLKLNYSKINFEANEALLWLCLFSVKNPWQSLAQNMDMIVKT